MSLTIQDILIRFLLAILIGGAIGYERELHHRAAGFRTHILVCVGAAVISMLQIDIGNKTIELIGENKDLANLIKLDYGRLGAQVITGVGFLGAGTIVHTKGNIKGLTTAATLWVVACLGLVIGMGNYVISIIGVIVIVGTLVFLKKFENRFIEKISINKIEIKYIRNSEIQDFIEKIFDECNVKIKSIEFIYEEEGYKGDKVNHVIYEIRKPIYIEIGKILKGISRNDSVLSIKELI